MDATRTRRTADLKPFAVRYKAGKRSRTVRTWTRFAPDIDAARESALKAIDAEFFGEGVLVSVEPSEVDPRP